MAGRRPRLVQEGSPIVEVEGSEYPSADANNFPQHSSSNTTSLGAHQGVHTAIGSQVSGNAYKLKTSLVIGEGASDDLDDSMMDDDDDHQNVTSADHANSTYYGCHGSVYHGQALENQHYNPSHMAVDAMHHQHQAMQQQHHPTQFFHNFQCNNNVSHIAPSHPTPTPIYHMPSPSISPLVVLDGANIAYSYSESINPISSSSSLRRQPDPRGIRLVIEYFLKHHCRVQAVVPTSWYQLKPRPGDTYHLKNRTRGDSDAKMITDEVEELRNLRQQGFLVAIPPGDDDDAYALALARREDDRLLEQQHHYRSTSGMQQHQHEGMDVDDNLQPTLPLGGYVVSNDMFHDAIRRDENRQYQQQQYIHSIPLNARPVSLKSWLKMKRISYSFANVGTPSSDEADTNEIRLDFIPNPRNELIESIDACGRLHI